MLATIHQPLQHNDALAVLASHLGEHDPQLKEESWHIAVGWFVGCWLVGGCVLLSLLLLVGWLVGWLVG